MLSFRYSSIFFYTFLCFSAGTSNGAVNPQNETLLARMRRKEPTDAEMIKAVVDGHNKLRGDITDAKDMTKIGYSKCLGGIAKEMIKTCKKDVEVSKESLAKYGKDKEISVVVIAYTGDKDIAGLLNDEKTAAGTLTGGMCDADACVNYGKMIFKDSLEVGCAMDKCDKFDDGSSKAEKKVTLCLYGGSKAYKKGMKMYTAGGAQCDDCKETCEKDPKLCKAPKGFKSTEEGCPSAGGKKKSMGVQSAKPQTVVAVILTAFLSLLLAH